MTAPVFDWSLVRLKPSVERPHVKEKDGKKLTDPNMLTIAHFVVRKVEHAGFAPEVNIELAAIHKGEQGEPWQAFVYGHGVQLRNRQRGMSSLALFCFYWCSVP